MRRIGFTCWMLMCLGCGAAKVGHQGVIEQDEETIAFEVGGRVTSVAVHEGERIPAGVVLAELDRTSLQLHRDQAAAALAVAQAERDRVWAGARAEDIAIAEARLAAAQVARDTALTERDRRRQLVADQAGTVQARDQAEEAAASAEAAFAVTQAELALLTAGARSEDRTVADRRVAAAVVALTQAEEDLRKTVAHAPPGVRVVRHVHLRPGEIAQPGVPVITVADESRPYADIFVEQAVLATLRVGQAVTLSADGGASDTGKIEWIGDRLEFTPRFLFGPQDRPNLMARVRVRLADGEGFHAGQPVDAAFGAMPIAAEQAPAAVKSAPVESSSP
jgi:HlyD family secretion protein